MTDEHFKDMVVEILRVIMFTLAIILAFVICLYLNGCHEVHSKPKPLTMRKKQIQWQEDVKRGVKIQGVHGWYVYEELK